MSDQAVPAKADGNKRFPCQQCGAQLEFSPGAQQLKCQYCGFLNEIPQSADDIHELDFHQYLEEAKLDSVEDTEQTVKCQACAAEFTVSGRAVSESCPFCGSHTVLAVAKQVRIQPKSLLPFIIDTKRCRDIYKQWITSRFWAPNALKDFARSDHGMTGMYVPYWTYDSYTTSYYTGMRGEYYYVTESYTDSNGNRQTRQVRKTRWYPASGTVWREFDDVLVHASTTLPQKHVVGVQSWDVQNLVDFRDEYLSGFKTERYNIGLEPGFDLAKGIMRIQIEQDVRYDIGGDEQQIHSLDTQYDAITFKHILVPIWLGAYKFKGKTYQFLINGRTGQISGEAPISPWKVAIAVILGIIVVGTIIYFMNKS